MHVLEREKIKENKNLQLVTSQLMMIKEEEEDKNPINLLN